MGFRKSISKREVYRNTILPQEIRKASHRQPNSTSKPAGKRKTNKQTNKPKVSRRKEIIKIRADINEKQMKETIAKINKIKAGSLRR